MVAKGDNTRVKRSYSEYESKLNDVHRMSNERVNYVGKSDSSLWGQVLVRVICHTRELAYQITRMEVSASSCQQLSRPIQDKPRVQFPHWKQTIFYLEES